MKKLLLILSFVSLTGCSTVMDLFPSRWDPNQAKNITDIQQSTRQLNCNIDVSFALERIETEVQWFQLYAEAKGTKDVAKLSQTLSTTIEEFQIRRKQGPVSPVYCELKKKLMVQQSDILAKAVQGRF